MMMMMMVCSESCPVCHDTQAHSDQVTVDCSVTLDGNWYPSLVISDPPTVQVVVDVSESCDNTTHSYHGSLTVSRLMTSSHDVYVTQLVFHQDRRPSTVSATNIPVINCTKTHVYSKLRLSSFILSLSLHCLLLLSFSVVSQHSHIYLVLHWPILQRPFIVRCLFYLILSALNFMASLVQFVYNFLFHLFCSQCCCIQSSNKNDIIRCDAVRREVNARKLFNIRIFKMSSICAYQSQTV